MLIMWMHIVESEQIMLTNANTVITIPGIPVTMTLMIETARDPCRSILMTRKQVYFVPVIDSQDKNLQDWILSGKIKLLSVIAGYCQLLFEWANGCYHGDMYLINGKKW